MDLYWLFICDIIVYANLFLGYARAQNCFILEMMMVYYHFSAVILYSIYINVNFVILLL